MRASFLLASVLVLGFASPTFACGGKAPTRTYQPEADVPTIEANGIRFAYFADGDPSDPMVLLLHGFPDTAHAWDELRPRIASDGYFVVSPFMRGYAPSDTSAGASYDGETIGEDALALIEAFGKEEAVVVGHDWGAVAAYSAAALDPSKVRKLVALVIPHPATLKVRLRDLYRTRHFVKLGRRNAFKRVQRDDYAYVDEIYERWSPTWAFTEEDLDPVKNSFAAPGGLEAALGYYRDLSLKTPDYMKVPTQMPALVIAGLVDGTTPLDAFDDGSAFGAGYQLEMLNAGHFPHRERPEEFLQLLLPFIDDGRPRRIEPDPYAPAEAVSPSHDPPELGPAAEPTEPIDPIDPDAPEGWPATGAEYVACGCGCCGVEPQKRCLEPGQSIERIEAEDAKAAKSKVCAISGCSMGIAYATCER